MLLKRPGRGAATGRCCPKCGYDVRALTEPRCPECGNDLKVTGFIALPIDTSVITAALIRWVMSLSLLIIFGIVLFSILSFLPDHYMPYSDFRRAHSCLVHWDDYRFHCDWVEEDTGWHMPGGMPAATIRRMSIKAPHVNVEFDDLSGYTSKLVRSYFNNLYIDIDRNQYWIGPDPPATSGSLYQWPLEPSTQQGTQITSRTAEQYFTQFLGNSAIKPRDMKAQQSLQLILDQLLAGAALDEITSPEIRLEPLSQSDWYVVRNGIVARQVIAGLPVLFGCLVIFGRLIIAVRRKRLSPKFCAKITG